MLPAPVRSRKTIYVMTSVPGRIIPQARLVLARGAPTWPGQALLRDRKESLHPRRERRGQGEKVEGRAVTKNWIYGRADTFPRRSITFVSFPS
jgi:hypothetical protein